MLACEEKGAKIVQKGLVTQETCANDTCGVRARILGGFGGFMRSVHRDDDHVCAR